MIQYFSELNPKERISGFIETYLFPLFEMEGFRYSRSGRKIWKANEWFDFHVTFFNNRLNQGHEMYPVVEFEIYINIHSPRYKRLEREYYGIDNKIEGSYMDGGNAIGLTNWDDTYCNALWYSLVKTDNNELIKVLTRNFREVAFPYFERFNSLESGIEELLKKSSDGKFTVIFDLLLMSGQVQRALEYFESHNSWFEEELALNDEESYFSMNYKNSYLLRKSEYEKRKAAM